MSKDKTIRVTENELDLIATLRFLKSKKDNQGSLIVKNLVKEIIDQYWNDIDSSSPPEVIFLLNDIYKVLEDK